MEGFGGYECACIVVFWSYGSTFNDEGLFAFGEVEERDESVGEENCKASLCEKHQQRKDCE